MKLELIEKIRKPPEYYDSSNTLSELFAILMFPLRLIVILFIALFIGVLALIQKISKNNTSEVINEFPELEEWSIFTNVKDLHLYQKYLGEVRFGPVYLNLRCEPEIEYLESRIFGDWFYISSDGIYLQEWNSIIQPDTNLVFIPFGHKEIQVVERNIPAVHWEMEDSQKDKFTKLICDTGSEIYWYKLKK